jgi:hypothetical protein
MAFLQLLLQQKLQPYKLQMTHSKGQKIEKKLNKVKYG